MTHLCHFINIDFVYDSIMILSYNFVFNFTIFDAENWKMSMNEMHYQQILM